VNSPTEISAAYLDVVVNSRIPDMIADLIGVNVKFHHSKINAKLPGAATAVKWHQDFPYTPHTNDDLVTALLAMDEVDETNGPLIASLALAAGLGAVALGLGARTLTLQQDLDASGAQVAALESTLAGQGDAMTVALDPSHVTVPLHGDALAPDAEAAVVFVPGKDASWIVARNLPATPSGHGYQLWYADASGVHPLQTVSYDGSGAFVAPIGVDLSGSSAVMLTLEPDGGALAEPGPQVVFGEL